MHGYAKPPEVGKPFSLGFVARSCHDHEIARQGRKLKPVLVGSAAVGQIKDDGLEAVSVDVWRDAVSLLITG